MSSWLLNYSKTDEEEYWSSSKFGAKIFKEAGGMTRGSVDG